MWIEINGLTLPTVTKLIIMGRKKKEPKPKVHVRIRYKQLANGNRSIYLDIYNKGVRTYEFLKLYLVPETTQQAKVLNENALTAAQTIQADRIKQINNNIAHIKNDYSNMLLIDWLKEYQSIRLKTGQSPNRAIQIGTAIRHIEAYNQQSRNNKITLGEADADYCRGFIDYLSTAPNRRATKNPKRLSKKAGENYFGVLASALKEAKRRTMIDKYPIEELGDEDRKPIKAEPAERGYLTIEELKAMVNCNYNLQNQMLKKAFLFACFTGFRISDIKSIKWQDIKEENGTFVIHKLMEKTRKYVDVPLPEPAIYWLPNKGEAKDTDFVFPTAIPTMGKRLQSKFLPSTESGIDNALKTWARMAGVNKNLSFHMSRHTYATMLITQGANIYAVKELLGHTDVKTTEIYAKLVDKKKAETVKLLNGIGM